MSMNSAKLMGPLALMRSAISSRSAANLSFPNCYELLLTAPDDAQADRASRRHGTQRRTRLGRVRDRLAGDLQNHVAWLERARRRALRIYVRDDRAACTGRQLELPRHLRRHV